MTERIRMLFLSTNPVESSRLKLGEEFRLINREIRSGTNGHLFDVSSAWAVRPEDLYELLLIHRPHIVHLSGHATKAKGIILEDDAGGMNPVSAKGLVGLFKAFRENVRIVFLNMCHTQSYVKELAEVVDYVVGIKNVISDRGAIVFSASFYKGLSFGLPVKMAFDLAANQMLLQRLPHHDAPILKVRESVNDSAPLHGESNLNTLVQPIMELAEKQVADSEMVPLFNRFENVGDGVSYELKAGDKRTSASKRKKTSMRDEIEELQREVSNLRADLQRLITIMLKKSFPDMH